MTWEPRTKASINELEHFLTSGRIDDAEGRARSLLATPSRNTEATIAIARCAAARGNLAEALRWADRAARIAPDDEGAVALHAALLLARGQATRALESLDRALPRLPHPHRPDTTLTLIHALLNTAEFGRATETLVPLLRATTAHADLTCRLAEALVQRTDQAGWMLADMETRNIRGAVRTGFPGNLPITISVDGCEILSLPLVRFLEHHGASPVPLRNEAGFCLPFTAMTSAQGIPTTAKPSVDVIVRAGGRTLLGAPIRIGPAAVTVEGVADVQGTIVLGWSRRLHHPGDTVEITVRDAAGAEARTSTVSPTSAPGLSADQGAVPHSFRLDLANTALKPGHLWVEAGPDRCPLVGSPVRWIDWSALVRARSPSCDETPLMATVAAALPWIPLPVGGRPDRPSAPVTPRARFDIIIPVYRGHHETMACLDSVVETTRNAPCEVVIINDASPDPALTADLRDFARNTGMTLLENPQNLGFPGTVNRGLAFHPDHDALILNADTVVAGDWWRRLRAAAYSRADIGTVTPLSNDATILSYPLKDTESVGDAGATPTAAETLALDGCAAAANAGLTVEIPTGVGFCMYIRRDCLNEIGSLNEDAFAHGYGEENDFCLRARHVGWRHLAATDVFVAHVGGRSFAQRKALLLARNLAILNRLHPGYDALIERFIADDPLALARRQLDLARWQPSGKPAVLLITLDLGGGVARHVADRVATLTSQGAAVMVLYPHPSQAGGPRRCRLDDRQHPGLRDLVFSMTGEDDALVECLRQAGVVQVEIHHTLNHDPGVLTLPRRLGVPYDMVLHDYGWLCPRITLIDGSGRYCREPAVEICERCVATHGSRHGTDLSVARYRQSSAAVLLEARSVIVPSDDAAKRLERYLPMIRATVTPWDQVPPPPAPAVQPRTPHAERRRVCIVGAIGQHKGYDIILACALDAARRDLPLDFTIVGYSEDDGPLLATGRIFITGPFVEGEAAELIMAQRADIGWLPSVWPETWCYALSECWRGGLSVIAFDVGAVAERIRRRGGGFLLPLDTAPSSINDALLTLPVCGIGEAPAPATLTPYSNRC